jgi:hypothetical protein
MKLLYIKTMKMAFLGVIPLLLLSGAGNQWIEYNYFKEKKLMVKFGDNEIQVKSDFVFKEEIEVLPNGSQFTTIIISVPKKINGLQELEELEFVIADSNRPIMGSVNYSIGEVPSFFGHGSKVFGVANYEIWGELPFFATSGNVRISHKEKEHLFGYIQMECHNQNGEKVKIRGPFAAQRSK